MILFSFKRYLSFFVSTTTCIFHLFQIFMADLYGTTASSSVNNGGRCGLAPSDSEEISHILNQLLHNSSASSCMSFSTSTNHLHSLSSPPTQSTTSLSDYLSASALISSRLGHPDCLPFSRPVENRSDSEFPVLSDPASGFGTEIKDVDDNTFSSGGVGLDITDSDAHNPLKGSRISSHFDDFGDFSCDIEKDASELQSNPIRPRISSKRTRDAEVHNLSEKRRRSKINEKMKVLQSLIPNSNKTDKASMLDEAIHYLKQLQLQVQMLAQRNGLSLHPMSLPGVAPPMQVSLPETLLGYNDGDHEFQNSNRGICRFTRGEESSLLSAYHTSSPCTNLNQPIGRPSASHTTNLENSIGCENLVPPHYRSLNQPTSTKELHNDGRLQMLSDVIQTEKKSSSDVNILSSRSPDVQ